MRITRSARPLNVRQKVINKMAEGDIKVKTFTGYTWAILVSFYGIG